MKSKRLPRYITVNDKKPGYELAYRVRDYQIQQVVIAGGITPDDLRAIADDIERRMAKGFKLPKQLKPRTGIMGQLDKAAAEVESWSPEQKARIVSRHEA